MPEGMSARLLVRVLPGVLTSDTLKQGLFVTCRWSAVQLFPQSAKRYIADTMPDGWTYWLKWTQVIDECEPEINSDGHCNALQADQGQHLRYVRIVG